MSFENSFGVVFWLSFLLQVLAAEAYLSKRLSAHGMPAPHSPRDSEIALEKPKEERARASLSRTAQSRQL
ncbi:MAG TPA: hypothetical protein VFQ48_02575 [Pseudonocardiaceae bacterium]|nr:hypothetical protein [Pseudonocardiaceae bacterium]